MGENERKEKKQDKRKSGQTKPGRWGTRLMMRERRTRPKIQHKSTRELSVSLLHYPTSHFDTLYLHVMYMHMATVAGTCIWMSGKSKHRPGSELHTEPKGDRQRMIDTQTFASCIFVFLLLPLNFLFYIL